MHIHPDGKQQLIAGQIPGGGKLHPNGFAMLRDGSFLIANRGDGREGGVWRLHRNGQVEPFLLEVDGITLPRTNFVLLDDQDRVWVSISTVHKPDYEFSPTRADGFVALVDKRGARIAGGGIVWTNECRINPAGTHMYVNETWAHALSRFRLGAGRQPVEQGNRRGVGAGQLCGRADLRCRRRRVDHLRGLQPADPRHRRRQDADDRGGLRARPHGARDRRQCEGKLVRTLVHENHHRTLGNISSLAFAGPDLRTAHMGSILSPHLVTFRSPVAGVPPAHWKF